MDNEKSRAKKLLRNTGLYAISNFGTKILAFLIVPLYTYCLTTAEFGTFDTINSVVGLMSPMIIFAIHEGILRWLLKSDEDEEEIISTGLSLYFSFVFACTVLLTLFFCIWKFDYSLQFVLLLFTYSLEETLQFLARGLRKNSLFAISGIIHSIVMLSLNVIFIVVFRLGVSGMLWSIIIAQISSSVFIYSLIAKSHSYKIGKFNKILAKNMLLYSIMLVPNNISWWVMNSSDRIMLTAIVGSSATGIYSLSCKFPSLLTMVHTLFYRAWQEQAVEEYDSKDRDEYYTKVFNIFMTFMFSMVLLLVPFSKLYVLFTMNDNYKMAYLYLGVLFLGSIFNSFSSFYGTGYISSKDTKNITFTTAIGAFVNCAINLVFMSTIGIWAACISTLCGYVVTWYIRVKQTKKYFSIAVNWKRFLGLLLVTGCYSLLICFTNEFLTIALFVVAFPIVLFFNHDLVRKGATLLKMKLGGKKMYDYLVVGSGLYGAVFAQQAKAVGKSVLVIDKRPNIAGNVYTEKVEGINYHKYGAHIFHTNNTKVWKYITQFATFNRFTNSPVANYKGELYSMPFNMYTFNKMWGVVTPEEAAAKIEEQKKEITGEPQNLEEQAISLVGRDIYEKLVKGYTEKQWGRDCKDLPAFIIKRLPVRLTFDNNYFNALYQGIPVGGYTKMVANLLEGIEVRLGEDYLADKEKWDGMAAKVVYTGAIDAYFGYCLGNLEYRSVRFENEILDMPNFQGNAAVNYTDRETPWTRIIEHKWFEFGKDEEGNDLPKTIISREYSSEWKPGDEPYYPVNDNKNGELYKKYRALADKEEKIIFGGRLGEYKYYDMDVVIASALECARKEL